MSDQVDWVQRGKDMGGGIIGFLSLIGVLWHRTRRPKPVEDEQTIRQIVINLEHKMTSALAAVRSEIDVMRMEHEASVTSATQDRILNREFRRKTEESLREFSAATTQIVHDAIEKLRAL